MKFLRDDGKIVVPIKVIDRPLKVAGELFGFRRAADGAFCQNREKISQIVAPPRLKLSAHFRRPGRRAGFVAVEPDEIQTVADKIATMFADVRDQMIEMKLTTVRLILSHSRPMAFHWQGWSIAPVVV